MKTVCIQGASVALLLCACQKDPKAAFTTDKEVYQRGETIITTNKSENSDSYLWTVSNSLSEYTSREPEILAEKTGECVITLKAYSKNLSKSNSTTRTVTITPGKGEITFYAGSGPALTSTVVISGYTLGPPTMTYGAIPDCRAAGTLTVALPEGPYMFTVTTTSAVSTSSLELEPGECKKVRLQ
jgi:hypothetical protein